VWHDLVCDDNVSEGATPEQRKGFRARIGLQGDVSEVLQHGDCIGQNQYVVVHYHDRQRLGLFDCIVDHKRNLFDGGLPRRHWQPKFSRRPLAQTAFQREDTAKLLSDSMP
jgi:hypothetical protein